MTTKSAAGADVALDLHWGCCRRFLGTLYELMAQWRRRVLIRNELITLNDSDLRDIGWTRAEVEAERRKPFWRA
jgi:uncharacterized protein YjiS (DUF1127 family)